MRSASIGPVKQALRNVHLGQVNDLIRASIDAGDTSCRERLNAGIGNLLRNIAPVPMSGLT